MHVYIRATVTDLLKRRDGTPVNRESRVHGQPIAVKIAAEDAQLRLTGALSIRYPVLEVQKTRRRDNPPASDARDME